MSVSQTGTSQKGELVVCSLVGDLASFRHISSNGGRTLVGSQSIKWACEQDAALVLFPAGFLRARSDGRNEIIARAEELLEAAEKAQVAIVLGVDICTPSWEGNKADLDSATSRGKLPFFVIAWAPRMSEPLIWRQRSTTSKNWALVPDNMNQEIRTFQVGQTSVGVVLCGEGFSVPIRNGLAQASPRPNFAVLPAHTAARLRHWHALSYFQKQGITAIRAVHAHGGAKNELWLDGGKKMPPTADPVQFRTSNSWVEASVFTL